nr:MAG TPA: hypothetical protein [Caudoviricetes sp.]
MVLLRGAIRQGPAVVASVPNPSRRHPAGVPRPADGAPHG